MRRALALAPASGVFRVADLTLLDYLLAAADDSARASAHRSGSARCAPQETAPG